MKAVAKSVVPMIDVKERLVRVEEAGEFLSVSRSQVYVLMDLGLLSYCQLPGAGSSRRARRIPFAALQEYKDKALVPAVA
jgi:hypothetical protein